MSDYLVRVTEETIYRVTDAKDDNSAEMKVRYFLMLPSKQSTSKVEEIVSITVFDVSKEMASWEVI